MSETINQAGNTAAENPTQVSKAEAQKAAAPAAPTLRPTAPIINPLPPAAPGAPEIDLSQLPQSTIEEMKAGRRALARNLPTAQALEKARELTEKKSEG